MLNLTASMMLCFSFIHLIPEGFFLNDKVMHYVFLGFLLMFFLHYYSHVYKTSNIDRKNSKVVATLLGLYIHSIVDGIIIAIGFKTRINIGIFTAFSILLHKIPDGITISSILLYNKVFYKKIYIYSIFSALLTPFASVFSFFILKNISNKILGSLLGLVSGIFIFLSTVEFIPEINNYNIKKSFIMFLSFSMFFFFIIKLF
jgi:ZIP family zinc transporter/zinc and cadmium transporter